VWEVEFEVYEIMRLSHASGLSSGARACPTKYGARGGDTA